MSYPNKFPVQILTYDDDSFSHSLQTKLACKGGARWIQFRSKDPSNPCYLNEAKKSRDICKKYQAKWIVNDDIKLAFDLDADGIHVGINDTPIHQIKKECQENFIIGGTAHNEEEILLQWQRGATYIGLGPFALTSTKIDLKEPMELQSIQKYTRQFSHISFIGIGGITLQDLVSLSKSGLKSIALCSSIHKHQQTQYNTQTYIQTWETALENIKNC